MTTWGLRPRAPSSNARGRHFRVWHPSLFRASDGRSLWCPCRVGQEEVRREQQPQDGGEGMGLLDAPTGQQALGGSTRRHASSGPQGPGVLHPGPAGWCLPEAEGALTAAPAQGHPAFSRGQRPGPASGQHDLLSYHIHQAPIPKQGRPVRSQVDLNFEGTVPKPSRGAKRASWRGLTCRGPGSKRCVPSPPPTQRTGEQGAGGTSSAHLGLCGSSGGKPRAGQTTVNHRPRRLFPHGHRCRPVSLSQPDGCHHAKPVRFQNRGEEGISGAIRPTARRRLCSASPWQL